MALGGRSRKEVFTMSDATKLIAAAKTMCDRMSDAIEDSLAEHDVELSRCPSIVGISLAHHVAKSMSHIAEHYDNGLDASQQWLTTVLHAIASHPELRSLCEITFKSEVRAVE
jgi:cell division septum initiation protein DivIVA